MSLCQRCAADPQPKHFRTPRKCAFDETGAFTPDNWNCATIDALLSCGRGDDDTVHGDDETLEHTYANRGWLVTTRYKRRGCTSSLIWVGDFYPPRSVTLDLVNRVINHFDVEDDED